MPLSWNEIKSRAARFSHEWKDTQREEADAKPFLLDFLKIFDISEKRYYNFEHRVKRLDKSSGYIDLLWPGMLLVEMKSRGQDLNKAYQQALEYCNGLKDYELPKLIMICDFQNFHVYIKDERHEFQLHELVEYLHLFEEIAGYQRRTYFEQDPVNVEAAELMGKLHDQLKEVGYTGSALEIYLVRLVFVLFADDSTIWQRGLFLDYLELRTKEDGSDLAMHLDQLFQVLDTPENKRLKTLDEQLNLFPYVNGRLFTDRLPTAAFNSSMRQILLESCKLDWGKISPAIFGSLFQSVMDKEHRRNLGAHYTSEKNILKVIKPLFMDELWDEFYAAGENQNKLKELHRKISKLRFLDPACGCGNFLITAYRELKYLEIAIVEKILKGQSVTNINHYFLVDLNQFYGIEYAEFPSQIAQVAMWLIDHQVNMVISEKFGEYIPSIPLVKSAVIEHANALRIDWQSIIQPMEGEVEKPRFNYILGNPPFVGKQYQSKEQKEDLFISTKGYKSYSDLDYVSGWFFKAAQYLEVHPGTFSFVSTSSICQGEQVPLIWDKLINSYKLQIVFAHRSFRWNNEGRGIASVHCIIVGLSSINSNLKKLFFYSDINAEPELVETKSITPYLTEGSPIILTKKSKPICKAPEIKYGNKPTDEGNLILNSEERNLLLSSSPELKPYIRKFIGSDDFINNKERYCLWLKDAPPSILKIPEIYRRIENVRLFRLKSSAEPTRKTADTPSLFFYISHPNTEYLLIPETSSERRKYIPIGYVTKDVIASNAVWLIPSANLYDFGILTSLMHMSWVRYTCGRLKSDYRYTGSLVYNNFPWPENVTDKQKQAVEEAAQTVLDARAQFPESSLADLYDPNTMPPVLVKAHQQLDKAVDLCYRPQPFTSEAKRIEYLFELYEKYTAGLFVEEKKSKKKKISK